ncbi:MAG: glycosyltransferase [Phycisphaerales bacterium]|nr:MAG: glycosyltransferase [Phycisphaerales bacterium]
MKAPIRPVICHVLHTLEGGGTERFLVALLRAFDHNAFEHVVVTLRGPGVPAEQLPDEVACRPLMLTGASRTAWIRLGLLARSCGASIIHARNTGCWFDATMARLLSPRTRIVLGFHGMEASQHLRFSQKAKARLGLRLGAGFSSVSETGAAMLREQAGIPPHRVQWLPNGIEWKEFGDSAGLSRRATRELLGFTEGEFVVGMVSTLTPVKRHDLLIQAFASLARANDKMRLLIVGDGPLRAELQRLATTEGIVESVSFAGARQDVPALLAAMDLYVQCSDFEGMSNALLEAMAAGACIVATRVGDNAAILRDGVDGHLVAPSDARALSNAIAELMGNASMRRAYGRSARARVRAFSLQRAVQGYEDYYRLLLGIQRENQGDTLGISLARGEPPALQAVCESDDRQLVDVAAVGQSIE